jgi:hypothetical protein
MPIYPLVVCAGRAGIAAVMASDYTPQTVS